MTAQAEKLEANIIDRSERGPALLFFTMSICESTQTKVVIQRLSTDTTPTP